MNNSIHNISDQVSNTIDKTPIVKDVVHKIQEEVVNTEHLAESKFSSLRKLYSNYVNSWFYNPTEDVSTYNLFTDWKFYVGIVVILGVTYWYFGDTIRNKFSNNTPFDPSNRDDDYGRPGPSNFNNTPSSVDLEAGHINTPDSAFRKTLPGRFFDFISGIAGKRNTHTSRPDPQLGENDLPQVPTSTPKSNSWIDRFTNHFSPESPLKGKGKAVDREPQQLFDVGSDTESVDFQTSSSTNVHPSSSGLSRRTNLNPNMPQIVSETRANLHLDNIHDEMSPWHEVYRVKNERVLLSLINDTKPLTINDSSTDIFSEVGTDNTPDLISDKVSVTDNSDLDSVYDTWGHND